MKSDLAADRTWVELNLDGLVGPTHHYAGLAQGNLASQAHRHAVSSPRRAVQEGLGKMRLLAELGIPQAILPPHERPNLTWLRQLGFGGSDQTILEQAHRQAPDLLRACASASSMWAANAATIAPSADTADGRVHFTPANLLSELHRSLEPTQTARLLQAIFPDPQRFAHHAPLPGAAQLGDEGAANHTRLSAHHGQVGIHLFTFGADALAPHRAPGRFPARQTLQASAAVARLLEVQPRRTLLVQQHPDAIDAGVFHNDVIAVGHRDLLLCHQRAWVDQPAVLARLTRLFEQTCGQPLRVVQVTDEQLSLSDAVATYLFNSQIIDLPANAGQADSRGMAMICPQTCQDHSSVRQLLDQWISDPANPIQQVHFVEVSQSMRNGGGPACLRLRVVLRDDEQAAMHAGVRWRPRLHEQLMHWSQRHYRDQLHVADLADPLLLRESRDALDELTRLLSLGSVYPFQRG